VQLILREWKNKMDNPQYIKRRMEDMGKLPIIEIEATPLSGDESMDLLKGDLKEELINREGLELKAYKPYEDEEYFTIGYGHYGPDVSPDMVITEEEAEELLDEDLDEKLSSIYEEISEETFEDFPYSLKKAIMVEHFRGSIAGSPKTMDLIAEGDFAKAAEEYLNNNEYLTAEEENKAGIIPRMEAVAEELLKYADSLENAESE
tara:strand:+ start:587 stop:1201 length:615 start_codon:yes stop_codon:yes gene_type:complete